MVENVHTDQSTPRRHREYCGWHWPLTNGTRTADEEEFEISGRLVDRSAAPIAGQDVKFRIVDLDSPDLIRSGRDGKFSFPGRADEPYELWIGSRRIVTVLMTHGRDLDFGDVALDRSDAGAATRTIGPVRITQWPPDGTDRTVSTPVARIAALYISCSASSTGWCDRGAMHIITDDGREVLPPSEEDQVGCSFPQISEDRLEAGWLIETENCCTSYSIPTALVVFRLGKSTRRFGTGMAIFGWGFVSHGKQVTFHTVFCTETRFRITR